MHLSNNLNIYYDGSLSAKNTKCAIKLTRQLKITVFELITGLCT